MLKERIVIGEPLANYDTVVYLKMSAEDNMFLGHGIECGSVSTGFLCSSDF